MAERPDGEEQTRDPKPEATPASLKSQADAVRRAGSSQAGEYYHRASSPGRMAGYLILIAGVLTVSVLLLIERESRLQLLETALGGWLPPEPGAEVFRLPPPPPPSPDRLGAPARAGAGATAPEAPPGILFLDEFPAESDLVAPPESEETGGTDPLPAKNDENMAAWELLKMRNEAVSGLLSETGSDLRFVSWAPVKEDPPEFWIDLTARRKSDDEEIHLVWSVNLETERIDPLSQAARDLEFPR